MKRRAVDWFIEALRAKGVEWIATLCGHGQDPLFDAARRAGLRLVDVRNEQTAGYMAEYWGRLTKRPGVASVSSGVAVANALTGVLDAWFDSAPMLLISGAADSALLGLGAFQDMDQAGLLKPVTRRSHVVDRPQRVLQMLDDAWHAALETPPAPVHLVLPMDVQNAEVDKSELLAGRPPRPPLGADPVHVEQLARRLADSARPLIVAGSGAYCSGEGPDLVAFAERFQIPVQVPIWDRGVVDAPSPCYCGVVGAATGGPDLISQADCVVLAGAVSDYRVGYLSGGPRVVSLERGWKPLAEQMDTLTAPRWESWLAEARNQRAAYSESIRARGEGQKAPGRMHTIDIVAALEEVLTPESVLLIDGGSSGQWAHQLLCDRRYPGHWLTCGRSAVVGWGLGGAMAARLAFPSRPVILLSGDGAFTFTVAELECAARQRLPFVAIVADDRSWGITHAGHLRQFGVAISTDLGEIRFDLLAQALGAVGRRIESPGELAPALREAIASGKVTVLHVPIVGGNPT